MTNYEQIMSQPVVLNDQFYIHVYQMDHRLGGVIVGRVIAWRVEGQSGSNPGWVKSKAPVASMFSIHHLRAKVTG